MQAIRRPSVASVPTATESVPSDTLLRRRLLAACDRVGLKMLMRPVAARCFGALVLCLALIAGGGAPLVAFADTTATYPITVNACPAPQGQLCGTMPTESVTTAA